ncbi:MAG: hypothetical protein AAF548_08875 [Actinomycetota bacterium]
MIGLLLAACGDDGGSSSSADPTTTAAPTSSDASDAEPDIDDAPAPGAPAGVFEQLGVEILALAAPEPGPHPLLSWPPVDGAARYSVVVQTADGGAFWGWVGDATEVRVGGGDRAELNQTAAVVEPMRWSLLAHDADGGLVGFGPAVMLEP